MNASPNEVALILDAIHAVRREVDGLRDDVAEHRAETSKSAEKLGDRIRTLERFRWQIVGAATLATAMFGLVLRFF